jgi:hypothetical protein
LSTTTTTEPRIQLSELRTVGQVVSAIAELDKEDASQVAEVFSNELLSDVSEDVIVDLVNSIDFENFSAEESIQIMETLSSAPDDVKEVFEKEVNIFSDDNFSTYVPTGSSINVAQRRVLIAAGATIIVAAAPAATGGRRR